VTAEAEAEVAAEAEVTAEAEAEVAAAAAAAAEVAAEAEIEEVVAPCYYKTAGCTFSGKHQGPCSTQMLRERKPQAEGP
jgi:hypothetical protein